MEIKEVLNIPYTADQKFKFIATCNDLGYLVQYTRIRLEAWGPTAEEIVEAEKEAKKQEILKQLDSLDLKSIRAIRANDVEYIAQYEAQAQELRKQLQEL